MEEFVTNSKTTLETTNEKDSKMTSIFGGFETEIVPEPFFTPADTYNCIVNDVEMHFKEDGISTVVTILWKIEEPLSDFNGNPLRQRFDIPQFTKLIEILTERIGRKPSQKEIWAELDPSQKKAMSFFTKTLRRGFDLSQKPNEAGMTVDNVTAEYLKGKEAYVTVVIKSGTGKDANKKFSNINDVVCHRIHQEEGNVSKDMANSLGL